jgi:hypothetical protein
VTHIAGPVVPVSELPRRQLRDRRRYLGTRAPPKKRLPATGMSGPHANLAAVGASPGATYRCTHQRIATILVRQECLGSMASNVYIIYVPFPRTTAAKFRVRYVHRLPVFPQAVSRVMAGQRGRYSQVRSRSHKVVHSYKTSVHIAIHKMPRVVCHWSRQLVITSWQTHLLMKAGILPI